LFVYIFFMQPMLMDELQHRVRTALSVARDEVLDEVAFWDQVRSFADGALADLVGRVVEERIYADASHANVAECLTAMLRLPARESSRLVHRAKALMQLPAVVEGLRTASISSKHADLLINALTPRTRDAMKIDEAAFVSTAATMSAPDWERQLKNWKADLETTGELSPRNRPSTMTLVDGPYGRGYLSADLCPSDYLEFKSMAGPMIDRIYRREIAAREAALEAQRGTEFETVNVEAAAVVEDLRPSYERSGEAFMQIVTAAANCPDNAFSNTPKASISIVVTPEQLAEAKAAYAVEAQAEITPAHFDRLTCDSDVYRTVMTNESEVLDKGREERTATVGQRKALVNRDRGCVVPGCGEKPRWCESHHVRWWKNGGKTNVDNMLLICRGHHTQIHNFELSVEMHPDQSYEFRRRDGTLLTPTRPEREQSQPAAA
jgi:hypothetical protein